MTTHTRTQTSRALIYTPVGAEKAHPVLCFLHGSGEAAPQPIESLLLHESPPWQAQNGRDFLKDFLVVCPQREKYGRWGPEDAGWVDSLVSDAIRQNHGDQTQLILTGFSFGGEGVFQLSSVSALPWKTLWAVDPAWQRTTPLPGDDVRVWVYYGDGLPGKEHMGDFARALQLQQWSEGARRIVTYLPLDHTGICRAAYGEASVYQWLTR